MPSHIYIGYDDRFADILMDPSRHVRRTTVAVLVLVRSNGSIVARKHVFTSSDSHLYAHDERLEVANQICMRFESL